MGPLPSRPSRKASCLATCSAMYVREREGMEGREGGGVVEGVIV